MKVLVTLATALVFSSFPALAQSSKTTYNDSSTKSSRPWFHVTPLVGVYGGSFQKGITSGGVENDAFQTQEEATTGILIDYNSHKAGFALQTGLVISKSNAVLRTTQNTVTGTIAYEDDYISIPLVGKFYPFTSSARWLYFRFGANLSYLKDSKRTTTLTNTLSLQSTNSSSFSSEVNIKDQREQADVQAVAGLGVIVPISKTVGVTIEGNYYHGFVNTDKSSGTARQELYTEGTSGTLGLSFAL